MKSNKTEILGFEDSWKKNRHVFGSTKSLAKVMYLDGQQSKQDEVDELQKRINDCIKAMDDSICDIDCGTIYGILTGDQS